MRGIFASENPVQPGFGAGSRFAAAPEQYLLHIKRCVRGGEEEKECYFNQYCWDKRHAKAC